MAVKDQDIFERLKSWLGEEDARALLQYFEDRYVTGVATKNDLKALDERLVSDLKTLEERLYRRGEGLMERLTEEINALEGRLSERLDALDERLARGIRIPGAAAEGASAGASDEFVSGIRDLDDRMSVGFKALDQKFVTEFKALEERFFGILKAHEDNLRREMKEAEAGVMKWSVIFTGMALIALIGLRLVGIV